MAADLAQAPTRDAARRGGVGIGRLGTGVATLLLTGGIAGVAAAQGGYFPTSWGWTALVFFWVAGLTLVLAPQIELSRAELAFLGLLAALIGWYALSIVWSQSVSDSVDELERTLVYGGGFLAFLLFARRGMVAPLLGAILAGLAGVSAYALATKLFPTDLSPTHFGGYRLATPVGYWNGLGLLAAIATLLALGFAASEFGVVWRALAAAALPMLVATLYFTYSRGAWVALAAGLALAIGLDPRRLHLLTTGLVLAPATAIAALLAYRSTALTHAGSTLHAATHEGHRLAVWIVLFAALSAASLLALWVVERHVTVSAAARKVYGWTLAGLAVVAVVAGLVAGGGPAKIARHAWNNFNANPSGGANLNSRLFQLSSNGRVEMWHVTWAQFKAHPVLGTGGGTFEEYWYTHRPSTQNVRDAHSVYLETLGELGLVGALILVAMFAVPFVGVRVRGRPMIAIALGAYTAMLVHAIYDWDWELPALILAGTWCGLAALVEARDEATVVLVRARGRVALLAGVVAVAGFAFVGLVGNIATARSGNAIDAAKWAHAASQARKAAAWAPWSARPRYLLSEAEVALGNRRATLDALRAAIDRQPRNYVLWAQLAYTSHGAEAANALRRARELNPRDPVPAP
jgi:O-antigen ligase/polysaccharide polymerase Wzy-like membrane protein